jgi:hypothetical protein
MACWRGEVESSPRPHAIGRHTRSSPARNERGQCRALLLPLLVVLGADHPPLLLPCGHVHSLSVRRWQPEVHGALHLRGGAILNEDPELLRSERERKRKQGQLKRSAQETRRGQGKQSASSLPATGRRLVALRSNPSAGAPLVPRSSRGNPIASGAGETAGLSVADVGTGVPEDELPQFTVKYSSSAFI